MLDPNRISFLLYIYSLSIRILILVNTSKVSITETFIEIRLLD